MRRLLVAAAAACAAACAPTGRALSIDVEPGCLSTDAATTLVVQVTLDPGPLEKTSTITDVPGFFAGGHRVEVIPPVGADSIDVKVFASDGDRRTLAVAEGSRAIPDAAGSYSLPLTLGSCGAADGGAEAGADGASADLASGDGPDLGSAGDAAADGGANDAAPDGPGDATLDGAATDGGVALLDGAPRDLAPPALDLSIPDGPLATLSFLVPPTRSAGTVTTVALGDLTGDGLRDVVAAPQYDTHLLLYRGNGDGTLAGSPTTIAIPSGNGAKSLFIVDVDGDGQNDIVLASSDTGTVQVIISGSQAGPVLTPAGATSIAVADLDGDKKPEIIAGVGGNLDVFFDMSTPGTVAYSAARALSSGCTAVTHVAAGDFDGDGWIDLAAACAIGGVEVLYNHVSGVAASFTTAARTGTSAWDDLAAADLDGDKKVDLVAVEYQASTYGSAQVLRSTGRAFTPSGLPAVAPYPNAIALGDFDGDGVLDLYLAHHSLQIVDWYRGKPVAGSVAFAPPISWVTSGDIFGIAAAPLTAATARDDLVVADRDIGVVDVLAPATGPVSAARAVEIGDVPGAPTGIAGGSQHLVVGDLDGDGRPDAIVDDYTSFHVFLAPAYAATGALSIGSVFPDGMALADLTGDGKVDVLVGDVGTERVVLLVGDGKGGFPTQQVVISQTGFGSDRIPVVGVADLDQDGQLDAWALFTNLDPAHPRHEVCVVLRASFGTVTPTCTQVGANPSVALAIDANGDGWIDVVTADTDANAVSALLNQGAVGKRGQLAPATTLYAITGPTALAFADLDADGNPELLVGSDASGIGTLSILPGSSTGPKAGSASKLGTQASPSSIVTADFDRDGKRDVALATRNGWLDVHRGTGTVTPAAQALYPLATTGVDLAPVDIDHDGRVDLFGSTGGDPGYLVELLNSSR